MIWKIYLHSKSPVKKVNILQFCHSFTGFLFFFKNSMFLFINAKCNQMHGMGKNKIMKEMNFILWLNSLLYFKYFRWNLGHTVLCKLGGVKRHLKQYLPDGFSFFNFHSFNFIFNDIQMAFQIYNHFKSYDMLKWTLELLSFVILATALL